MLATLKKMGVCRVKIAEVDGNDPLYKVKRRKTPGVLQPLLSAIAAGASRLWRRERCYGGGCVCRLLRKPCHGN